MLLDMIERGELPHRERRFRRGEVLWFRGEPNDEGLYLLVEGKLKASYYTLDGKEHVINILEPVALLGEISSLTGLPHSLTVEGYEDGRLLLVPAEELRRMLAEKPELWREVAINALERLWNLTERYLMIASMDAKGRVLNLLLNLSKRKGDILKITHEQISSMCALSRETVSRVLKALEREGYIELGRGTLRVLKREA